jgi:GH24 family phage-related lysozyme (muramidase)
MGKGWIERGDSGYGVKAWQRIVGVPPAHVDGVFGPETDRFVRAWQTARNVEPDGVIGALTRAAVVPTDLIIPFEGFLPYAYDDADDCPLVLDKTRHYMRAKPWIKPNGALTYALKRYPTIGYGRLLIQGVDKILSCTRAMARGWLEASLATRYLPPCINALQDERDAAALAALASFSYNLGAGAVPKLAAAEFAPSSWASYDHSAGREDPGLHDRRLEEVSLFWGPTFDFAA